MTIPNARDRTFAALTGRRPIRPRAFSGKIWTKSPATRIRTVARVCSKLRASYGRSRLGNPRVAIDDLVYIIVSNKTSPVLANRVFAELQKIYRGWDAVVALPVAKLRSILRPAGLSRIKSRQLWQALRKIKRDFGECDLSGLNGQSDEDVHLYLTSLPGVSDKVAKCVMMYTMGSSVLPVDAHVHRVATRLGWTSRKRADQCHEELESLVPAAWRYSFHVACVLHGRSLCRPTAPLCSKCCIKRFCDFYQRSEQHA